MIIKYLPILPPNLRPLVHLEDGTVILTDLNILYTDIMCLNKLIKFVKVAFSFSPKDIMINERLALQNKIDKLINNEKPRVDMLDYSSRTKNI
jgi:DNA-directed RNA polymerase subunit beta'